MEDEAKTSEGKKAMRLLHSGKVSRNQLIERNQQAICSLVLGRDFGETFEDYMIRCPSVAHRERGYREALRLLG